MKSAAVQRSAVIKRSIVLHGRKTSVSIEEIFWNGLKEIARDERVTLSKLVGLIDGRRAEGSNLSSAIRVFILIRFKDWAQSLARSDLASRPAVQPPSIAAMRGG